VRDLQAVLPLHIQEAQLAIQVDRRAGALRLKLHFAWVYAFG